MEKKPNKQTNKVFENLIIGEKRTCGFLGYGNFLWKRWKKDYIGLLKIKTYEENKFWGENGRHGIWLVSKRKEFWF